MSRYWCNLCNDFEGDEASIFAHYQARHPQELDKTTKHVIIKNIDKLFVN